MYLRLGALAVLTTLLLLLVSCGGSPSGSSTTGRAAIRITWPAPGRLIPSASNGIQITITQGQTPVASQVIARPTSGNQTSTTINNLKIGPLTLTATAYPNTNATGVAQATGTTPVTIQAGQTTSVSLTMASTISRLDLTPANPIVAVGSVLQLTATARDSGGNVVLLAPSKLQWNSSSAMATVSASGAVTGVSKGSATIDVTDQESGRSTSVLVTVSGQTHIINGITYVETNPTETLTATFTTADGGVTTSSYAGYVLLHVTGVGQAYGGTYNDAFYLYTSPFNAPQNGHDGGFYQLAFGTSPLVPFSLGSNAKNFLVDPLPAYTSTHDYTFVLDTRLTNPGLLHFGVTDGGYDDNTGAYTITVTQLVPTP